MIIIGLNYKKIGYSCAWILYCNILILKDTFRENNDIWTPIALKKKILNTSFKFAFIYWTIWVAIHFRNRLFMFIHSPSIPTKALPPSCWNPFFYILVPHRDDLCSSTGIWPFSCRLTTVLYKLSFKGVNFIPRALSLCVENLGLIIGLFSSLHLIKLLDKQKKS